jgi:lycopene elongase/hydratase (dihydrobisanhydrobacterioruberin-forming)
VNEHQASKRPAAPDHSRLPHRTHSRLRGLGYRLLPGDAFSYVLHLRPREWPIMAAHTTVGFVLAVGPLALLDGGRLARLGAALGIWVIGLNGGTLAINSAFDRDTGDIGYLDAPPPVPRGLLMFGLMLMGSGQLLALSLPHGFALAYAACFTLSVLYSIPPFRFKAVAGVDWIINMIGFGSLTPYAGWAATGVPVGPAGMLVLLAFCPLFAALYPLTQLYQLEEDRARGDRTLALMLGMRASLSIAIAASGVAFACFAVAAMLGRIPIVRALPLGISGLVWLTLLMRWSARHQRMTVAEHKRGMYAALGAWGLTDIAVLIAFAPSA